MIGNYVISVMNDRRRQLNKKCLKMIKNSNTVGTRANQRTHHRSYVTFCNEHDLITYPATEWQYVQYAVYLYGQDKVPQTVQNYISTIKSLHKLNKLPVPKQGEIYYNKCIEGIKKHCKKPVKQAEAMTHETLYTLYSAVNFADELEAVAWVVLLVGFSLVLRVSNLGPSTRGNFDPEQNLMRGDMMIKEGCITLRIRWAKNCNIGSKRCYAL